MGLVELHPGFEVDPDAVIFTAINHRITVKLMRPRKGGVCRGQVALELLIGLEGCAPRVYQIVSGLPEGFEHRAIVFVAGRERIRQSVLSPVHSLARWHQSCPRKGICSR